MKHYSLAQNLSRLLLLAGCFACFSLVTAASVALLILPLLYPKFAPEKKSRPEAPKNSAYAMKRHPLTQIINRLLFFVCCFVCSNVSAHTPHAREAYGVILTIDYPRRLMTLNYGKEHGPKKLAWVSATQFLRDWKPVPATELKAGAPVTVYYHSPFLGKPTVTKVVWTAGA